MEYDVAIVGGGPAGIFCALRLMERKKKVILIERGNPLELRKCPSIENKTNCKNCKVCSITSGLAGAGAFSDGKFPITNEFGGTLWKKIGRENALKLMREVDDINCAMFCTNHNSVNWPRLYTANSIFKKKCTQYNLNLLEAEMRHLGTDYVREIYTGLIDHISEEVEIQTNATVVDIGKDFLIYEKGGEKVKVNAKKIVVAAGRSGSKWVKEMCEKLNIPIKSNRVDIGIRFECPDSIWNEVTARMYESKITYRTKTYEDVVRTFCMNRSGYVVAENTAHGGITVNGHSFEDPNLKSQNTNFALLVSKTFTEPFNDSSEYGEAIAKMTNMLGGGVIVQRYGDLIRGKRSTKSRIEENTVRPTLNAEPGDLSLVLPKRILDDILEMIEALEKILPGMKNDDNLLYGTEIKTYNNVVEVDEHLSANGIYFIGDGSGTTHSLSQASASGLYVAEQIVKELCK